MVETVATSLPHSQETDDAPERQMSSPSAMERRHAMDFFSVFDVRGVSSLFAKHDIKMTHAFKMWRYLLRNEVQSIDSVPGLPKLAYKAVGAKCRITTLEIAGRQDSSDGSTTKLLINLQDGQQIESVIMRYGQVALDFFPSGKETETNDSKQKHNLHQFRSAPRATLCVSSQVGCSMGCRFCSTGSMGLLSNLTSGEILEQLVLASRIEPIRNIVFMGMGEPLDNYNEVIDSIKLMTDVRVFNLASHRVSISTVGVVPRLLQLKNDVPGVSLALSLHAPTQNIREKIVPSAKAWDIHDIMAAAVEFVSQQKQISSRMKKNQTILLQYVMIDNMNCDAEIARLLGEFLHPYASLIHLNVIPYNPSINESVMRPPTQDQIDTFVSIIRGFNIKITVRQTLGQDIASACGQLVTASTTTNEDNKMKPIRDLEDLEKPNCQFILPYKRFKNLLGVNISVVLKSEKPFSLLKRMNSFFCMGPWSYPSSIFKTLIGISFIGIITFSFISFPRNRMFMRNAS